MNCGVVGLSSPDHRYHRGAVRRNDHRENCDNGNSDNAIAGLRLDLSQLRESPAKESDSDQRIRAVWKYCEDWGWDQRREKRMVEAELFLRRGI
jgi:hypothetical protein